VVSAWSSDFSLAVREPPVNIYLADRPISAELPETEIVALFRKLDPQAKDLVRMTAQRMAR